MYIANSRVRHFRNYLRFINICNSNQRLCSATCHILNVMANAKKNQSRQLYSTLCEFLEADVPK